MILCTDNDCHFNVVLQYGIFLFRLQGNLGPFVSGLPMEVPLWLAIYLKQKKKCDLILPDWLTLGKHDILWLQCSGLCFQRWLHFM